jgi:hypothetical protein
MIIKFFFTVFLVFVLFVFIFGFSILRMLFGGLFGSKPKQNQKTTQNKNAYTQQKPPASSSRHQKKIIDPNEGEYIEYEEIKD